MEIFFFWFIFALLVGLYARKKGRSGIGFFFLSVLLSPLLGLLIALVVDEQRDTVEARQLDYGGLQKFPFCAELIKPEAIVCKHCGRDLPILEDTPTPITASMSEEEVEPSDDYNWGLIVAGGVGLFLLLAFLTY